jgi:hypothetical protein
MATESADIMADDTSIDVVGPCSTTISFVDRVRDDHVVMVIFKFLSDEETLKVHCGRDSRGRGQNRGGIHDAPANTDVTTR